MARVGRVGVRETVGVEPCRLGEDFGIEVHGVGADSNRLALYGIFLIIVLKIFPGGDVRNAGTGRAA